MSDIPIKPVGGAVAPSEVERSSKPGASNFAESLKEALSDVSELQAESNEQIQRVLKGEVKDVHSAMLALEKADLSFQLMLQVRNKLVQAYRDVMRMQG